MRDRVNQGDISSNFIGSPVPWPFVRKATGTAGCATKAFMVIRATFSPVVLTMRFFVIVSFISINHVLSCRKKIHHSFHPGHQLTIDKSRVLIECGDCKVCGYHLEFIFYKCVAWNCDFRMHVECAYLKPNIKHEAHQQHLLTLVDNCRYTNTNTNACKACNSAIKSLFNVCCVECNIRFHLQCGNSSLVSLPETIIVHEHHQQHPLMIRTSASNLLDDGDHSSLSLILYCDVCKKETINQKYPFYSCSDSECD